MRMPHTTYFGTDWFHGQTFGQLVWLFLLFSSIDLLATIRMIPFGVREGNEVANLMLTTYGTFGFALYKFALVTFVVGLAWIINRYDRPASHRLLWGGILLMTAITLVHLTIIAGMAA